MIDPDMRTKDQIISDANQIFITAGSHLEKLKVLELELLCDIRNVLIRRKQ